MSFSAAARAICLPVSTEPVKVILPTFGRATNGAPHSGPKPDSILATPAGNTWFIISMMRKAANGASSADLTTTVLPAASAGAILNAIRINGAFQGRMAPTTPTGSRGDQRSEERRVGKGGV